MGDFLIVSLTLDQFVNKGPNRPCFKWDDRASVLRELRSVDCVLPTACAVDAIRQVRPAVFVKGRDYMRGEFTEDIAGALAEVGAKLHITTTAKRSSTELLRRAGII